MTFDRTKNVGLALLILLLAFIALLGHWESGLSRAATRAIEHEHNPALQLAQRQRTLVHATEVAFEVYRRRDWIFAEDVTALFDELLERSRRLEAPSTGDARSFVVHVAAARIGWLQILAAWEEEQDPASDSLLELRYLVEEELLAARLKLGVLVAGGAVQASFADASPDATYRLARQASSLIHLLGVELDAFLNQEPIDLQDVLEPVGALIASLERDVDGRTETTDPTSGPIREARVEALRAAHTFRGLLYMFGDTQADWTDGHYHETLDTAAGVLKEVETAVLRLARHRLDEVSAAGAALEAGLERAARLRDALSGLGVLLALLIAVALGRTLGRHVTAIVAGTRALASGELGHRLPEPRGDRLGELAGAFNSLAERLEEKEREQVRYVDALDRAVDEARAASAAKGEFLASMSHEIRTPINGVLGTADLLLREGLSRSQRHLVETIRRSGASLLGIINDILDFSKIEAGRMELEPAPFDLTLLIEDVCEMAAPAAHGKGLELNGIVPTELTVTVVGDALRLRQVLTNLIGNAIKFTPSGEVIVEVGHRVTDTGERRYRFDVRDTGIGIDADAQARIYAPFSQANRSTAHRYGGTGLGLSITQELVRLMGGETGLESTPGHGSRFWFELPLELGAAPPEACYDDVGCTRALLICHSESACRALCTRLGVLGIDAESVGGGREAIAALSRAGDAEDEAPFEVLFVDDRVEDMGFAELARQIERALPAPLRPPRVALCRVDEDEAITRERRAAGFSAQLLKPVRQSALYNCLLELHDPRPEGLVEAMPERAFVRLSGRVLLVEDHAVNQDIVTRMLVWLGCEVTLAEDGRTALRRLERERFDLVLMDCDMPVMDGFEATRRLRERERGAAPGTRHPVVALTANALSGDRERCLAAGMDDYLTKPIVLETLHRTLLAWLPGRDQADRPPDGPARQAPAPPADVGPDGAQTLIDPQVIDALRAMEEPGSDGFVDALVGAFAEGWPRDRDALVGAARDGDAERVRRAAHRLKSASANLGAVALAALCAEIEAAAARGELALDPPQLTALDDVYRHTLETLLGRRREAA